MSTAPLQIDSAADLFAALRAPDVPTRIGVLKAVAAQPQAVAACRDAQGVDLLDWLLADVDQTEGSTLRLALLAAIAAFDDPRVVAAFAARLPHEWEAQAVDLLAARLWPCRDSLAREPLSQLLLQGEPSPRMRAAALLLADRDDLSAAEHLRLCLLAEPGEFPTPWVSGEAVEPWLAELNGPLALSAQGQAELLGQPAAESLLACWQRLDPAGAAWLAAWAGAVAPAAAAPYWADWLNSDQIPLRLAALQTLAHDVSQAAAHLAAIDASLSHHDPSVRRAAVTVADAATPWRSLLATEPHVEVVGDLLRRLVGSEGAEALPDLAAAMVHPAWEVRGVAAELLATLGDAAVPLVRELCGHARAEVRLAAARAAVALGDDAWLDEELPAGDA